MALFSGLPDSKRQILLFMAMLNFGSTIAFQGWTLLYNNFAVNCVGLDASQSGIIQGMREIPGLLGFALVFFLFFIKEHRFAAICAIGAGVGTLLTGFSGSFEVLLFTSLLMSFGFHYFESMNSSLAIEHFDLKQTPIVMGRLRGLVAGGSLAISAFVFIFADMLSFQWLFFVPGILGVLLGLAGLFCNPLAGSKPPEQSRRILPKKRYWLFYLLNLLVGGRRIILSVFVVFLLVEHYGYSVRSVSILFMLNFTVNWILNPMVGVIINKLGERKLMTIEYTSAVLIFAGYAFIDSSVLAVILYVFDSLTFNFSIATRTFFQKISLPEDAAPNMALAQTINHIPAVTIPALGGWMWIAWGYETVFYTGIFFAACSLLLVQFVDREIAMKGTQKE